MNASHKRRSDDYRPASIRRLWDWLYRTWWGFEGRMARWYDFAVLAVLVIVVIAIVVLACIVLAFLWG